LKFKTNLEVDEWLMNFGSFPFLIVAACRGWKNGNVPKFAFECMGINGLCFLEASILRVVCGFLLTICMQAMGAIPKH
jgi:hypothetical protein